VAEQTAWQAVPAMLFVERHEFGLNALLGLKLTKPGLNAFTIEVWRE
jgi:hypothetical protein